MRPADRRIVRWLLAGAVLLVAIYTARVLRNFAFRYTDDDQALYWFAAQDFLHGHFREPFFYGQLYNPMVGALVSTIPLALSIPVQVAVPAVSISIGLLTWIGMALLAVKRHVPTVALLALGAVLLLPPTYAFLLTLNFNAGIFIVAIGVIAGELLAGDYRRGSAFGLAAGVGTFFVNTTAGLLAVPAGLHIALEGPGRLRRIAAMIPGLLVGWAANRGAQYFYELNPAWHLTKSPDTSWSLSRFEATISSLHLYLGAFGPWFWPRSAAPLMCAGVIVVIALVRRRWTAAAAGLAFIALTVASFGIDEMRFGDGTIFFSFARLFLAFPVSLTYLAVITLGGASEAAAAKIPWRSGRWPIAAPGAAAVLIVVAFAAQMSALQTAIATDTRFPAVVYTGPRTVASVTRECSLVQSASRTTGTELVVFLVHRVLAYGCEALDYGEIETIYPQFERRTWVLLREASMARRTVLFAEAPNRFCDLVRRQGDACRVLRPGLDLVVQPPGRTSLDLLRELGIPIRAF